MAGPFGSTAVVVACLANEAGACAGEPVETELVGKIFCTAEEAVGGTPDDDELSVLPRAFMDEMLLCLPSMPAPRDAERDEAPAEGVVATFSSEVARIIDL
jgi:hypothetical protein